MNEISGAQHWSSPHHLVLGSCRFQLSLHVQGSDLLLQPPHLFCMLLLQSSDNILGSAVFKLQLHLLSRQEERRAIQELRNQTLRNSTNVFF